MIGRGREVNSIYILLTPSASTQPTSSYILSHTQKRNCLGHASLSLLHYFGVLSSFSTLECESCRSDKHYRISFPSRVDNVSLGPFDLVHSNI